MRCPICLLLLIPLAACAGGGEQSSDTAASIVPASETARAPAALRPADVAGTWNGLTLALNSDSVLRRWTSISTSDSTGVWVLEGAKDSIPLRSRFEGDSMITTSAPFTSPTSPRGPRVVLRSTGRLRDGRLEGTGVLALATNPDSVVSRSRWRAERAP